MGIYIMFTYCLHIVYIYIMFMYFILLIKNARNLINMLAFGWYLYVYLPKLFTHDIYLATDDNYCWECWQL